MSEIDVKGRHGTQQSAMTRRSGGGGLTRRGLGNWWAMDPLDLWNASPWDLMRRFTEDMGSAFQGGWSGGEGLGGAPALEVFRREGDLVVRAELPGVQQQDVKVELTDDGLLIQGERKRDFEDKGEGFYRSERSYGSFQRLVPLPPEAQGENAHASFKDGVLEVCVPLPEQKSRRRQIPIGTEAKASGTAAGGGSAPPREAEPELAGAGASSKGARNR